MATACRPEWRLVAFGAGLISAVSCMVIAPLVGIDAAQRDGLLVTVLSDWAPPPIPVHAVFASARYLTPKVRAFIDLAVEAMGPISD